jgi:hypothetical protein
VRSASEQAESVPTPRIVASQGGTCEAHATRTSAAPARRTIPICPVAAASTIDAARRAAIASTIDAVRERPASDPALR